MEITTDSTVKITQLDEIVDNLLSNDVFVISRTCENNYYESKNVTWDKMTSNVYSKVKDSILSDTEFLSNLVSCIYPILLCTEEFIEELREIIVGEDGTLYMYSNYQFKTNETKEKEYKLGQPFNIPTIEDAGFYNDGYVFQNWKDFENNTYVGGEQITLNDSSYRLSAIWKGKTVRVTFKKLAYETSPDFCLCSISYGTTVQPPPNEPESPNPGKLFFTGWSYDFSTKIIENTIIFPNFSYQYIVRYGYGSDKSQEPLVVCSYFENNIVTYLDNERFERDYYTLCSNPQYNLDPNIDFSKKGITTDQWAFVNEVENKIDYKLSNIFEEDGEKNFSVVFQAALNPNNPSTVLTIKYSEDGGQTWLDTPPSHCGVGEYPIEISAFADNYRMVHVETKLIITESPVYTITFNYVVLDELTRTLTNAAKWVQVIHRKTAEVPTEVSSSNASCDWIGFDNEDWKNVQDNATTTSLYNPHVYTLTLNYFDVGTSSYITPPTTRECLYNSTPTGIPITHEAGWTNRGWYRENSGYDRKNHENLSGITNNLSVYEWMLKQFNLKIIQVLQGQETELCNITMDDHDIMLSSRITLPTVEDCIFCGWNPANWDNTPILGNTRISAMYKYDYVTLTYDNNFYSGVKMVVSKDSSTKEIPVSFKRNTICYQKNGNVYDAEFKLYDDLLDKNKLLEVEDINTPILYVQDGSFENCSKLKNFNFNNAVKIGNKSFNGCSKLSSISVDSVENIGDYAFNDCYALISVEAQNTKDIGSYSFFNCRNLKEMIFESLSSIGDYSFALNDYDSRFDTLTSLTVPNLKIIGNYVFSNRRNIVYLYSPNVTSIGNNAFSYSSLENGIEMSSVLNIGNFSFSNCGLKTAFCPLVKYIGSGAFYNCQNLESITCPNISDIFEISTFTGCDNLKNVVLSNAQIPPKIHSCAFPTLDYPISIIIPNGQYQIYMNTPKPEDEEEKTFTAISDMVWSNVIDLIEISDFVTI